MIRTDDRIYYALAADQVDTGADIRGYAVLLRAGASIVDPGDPEHRFGIFLDPQAYTPKLIAMCDGLAYLAVDAIDDDVAEMIELAHDLRLPVYRIVGRELVEEDAWRIAA
jgi:hypothetical protein